MQNKLANLKDSEIPALWRFALQLEDRIVELENNKEDHQAKEKNDVSAFDDLKNFDNPNQPGKTLMESFSEELLGERIVEEDSEDADIKKIEKVVEVESIASEYLNPIEERYFIPHAISNTAYKLPNIDYFLDGHFKCLKQRKIEHESICEFCHLQAMHVSHRSYENLHNEHFDDLWSLCDWHFREVSERVDANGQPPHPPFSPEWIAISPTGHSFQVVSLKKFSQANQLHGGTLGRLAAGKQKNYKGWKCYKFASYLTNLYAQQPVGTTIPISHRSFD